MSPDIAHSPQRSWSAPSYPDASTRLLGEQLDRARARRDELRQSRAPTGEVDREILDLRRQLREGGQLRAGDALADGRYLLLERVGRGGFAVVWRALDRTRDLAVAIKVLHGNLAGDPERRERFFRGARVMKQLQHQAVVRVLEEQGEDEGFHYFVMQFLPGGDLRQAVMDKKVPPQRVIPLVLRIGEALTEAHGQGLIHRDVKPANILLDARGEPRLTDFDLVGGADTTGGTRTGAMGTFIYAAPECLDRPEDADARADVYGLAMTAVFCLQGSDLSVEVVRDAGLVIEQLPCTRGIQAVLKRATAWDRKHRYKDAGELCQALMSAIVLRKGDFEPPSEGSSRPVDSSITQVRDSIASLSQAAAEAAPPSANGRRDGPEELPAARRERRPERPRPAMPSAAIYSMLPPALPGAPAYSMPPPALPSDAPPEVPAAAAAPRSRDLRLFGVAALAAALFGGYALSRSRSNSAAPATKVGCHEGMVLIPGATFTMGLTRGDEAPPHPVELDAYCIDRTEVTMERYRECMTRPRKGVFCAPTATGAFCNQRSKDFLQHPANCVVWSSAEAYCRWAGGRLPTEAEWEYAARGPGEVDGDTAEAWSCWRRTSGAPSTIGTCPVGSILPGKSWSGLLDMTGNVAEWTQDWHGPYPTSLVRSPGGASTGELRVARGGAWSDEKRGDLSVTRRLGADPFKAAEFIGFRCVRAPGP